MATQIKKLLVLFDLNPNKTKYMLENQSGLSTYPFLYLQSGFTEGLRVQFYNIEPDTSFLFRALYVISLSFSYHGHVKRNMDCSEFAGVCRFPRNMPICLYCFIKLYAYLAQSTMSHNTSKMQRK